MLALGYMHLTGALVMADPSCGVGDQKKSCLGCLDSSWPLRPAGLPVLLPELRVTLHVSRPSACPTGSHGLPKDYGTAKRYLQEAVASGQAMSGGSPRQWSGLGDAYFYLGAGTA